MCRQWCSPRASCSARPRPRSRTSSRGVRRRPPSGGAPGTGGRCTSPRRRCPNGRLPGTGRPRRRRRGVPRWRCSPSAIRPSRGNNCPAAGRSLETTSKWTRCPPGSQTGMRRPPARPRSPGSPTPIGTVRADSSMSHHAHPAPSGIRFAPRTGSSARTAATAIPGSSCIPRRCGCRRWRFHPPRICRCRVSPSRIPRMCWLSGRSRGRTGCRSACSRAATPTRRGRSSRRSRRCSAGSRS